MQQNLFEVPEMPKAKPAPGKRCKNCIHCYEHQYNSTKYCELQRQKGTSYGDKKIKANDAACPMFEKKARK